MDKKTTAILSYFGLIFLIIAICAGDKEGAKQHLNQNLVMQIANLVYSVIAIPVSFILGLTIVGLVFLPIVMIPYIAIMVFTIWGLVYAITDNDTPLPLIGGIQIIK